MSIDINMIYIPFERYFGPRMIFLPDFPQFPVHKPQYSDKETFYIKNLNMYLTNVEKRIFIDCNFSAEDVAALPEKDRQDIEKDLAISLPIFISRSDAVNSYSINEFIRQREEWLVSRKKEHEQTMMKHAENRIARQKRKQIASEIHRLKRYKREHVLREIIEERFHPRNISKFPSWGFEL